MLTRAKTRAEGTMTLALPGTTKPESGAERAARTLPTSWAAKSTSETKWAAWTLSLT